MNPAYVTAVAVFAGSLVGGLTTFAAGKPMPVDPYYATPGVNLTPFQKKSFARAYAERLSVP